MFVKEKPLTVRAYGRNIHNLVEYAKHIPERRARQMFTERIIDLMMQLYPAPDDPEEHYLRLWTHLLKMADYELDVLTPDGVELYPVEHEPEPLPYPRRKIKHAQYGHNVQILIERAKDIEPWKQDDLLELIGSYMKLAYNSWGRDVATDEIIYQDFYTLARGELKLTKGIYLDAFINPRKHIAQGGPNKVPPPAAPNRKNNKKNRYKKRR